MLDISKETRVPLSEAPKQPLLRPAPGKRPVHRSVLERWRTRGIRGVVSRNRQDRRYSIHHG
jgi:hypothetical protein